jgi:CRP-like cAMP-binding protein
LPILRVHSRRSCYGRPGASSGPARCSGQSRFFTDGRCPADAITLAETLKARWSETELLDLIHRHPQIAVNVIRVIGKRLQEVQERVRKLATQRTERRVAHAVLRLARMMTEAPSLRDWAVRMPPSITRGRASRHHPG